ncbi:MAG: hypothetical protein V4721_01955 [Bacteroidota bacterium]
MKNRKALLCTVLTLLFAYNIHAQEASDIIKQSAAKYDGMKVYMDSGKVVSSFYNLARPHSTALLFKTAYANNGSFNFEYYQLGSTDINVLNRDAEKQVKVWQGFSNRLISGQPLKLAMAGFVGISSFTVALVPTLLMAEEKLMPRTIFDQIAGPKVAATEMVSGVECYKIVESKPLPIATWVVWISKSDFMIRKAEIDRKVNDFNVRATYTYFPYTSADPSIFAFKPNRKVSL